MGGGIKMVYKALYREWRPRNFDEMVGQHHVTKILKNQIENNKTGHAYLFCGTRGTGKTSAAKILAMGVNCLSLDKKPCGLCENCKSIQDEKFMDVIEMDAASNNGVDNIRELKESIKYPPVKGKYKVYIIDEVHMLSTGAFNALLKTLEEPPEYIKFILATTEIHKLPATILSRCQRFDFKRISEEDISYRIEQICLALSIEIDKNAIMLIVKNSEGSVRDALSILDQCLPFDNKTITVENIIEILGTVKDDFFLNLADNIASGNTEEVMNLIHEIVMEGKDIHQFMKDLIYFYRNLLMTKVSGNLENIIPMSHEDIERLKEQGKKINIQSIKNTILELSNTSSLARYSSQPRILLELVMVKLCNPQLNDSIDGLLERIEHLEKLVSSGIGMNHNQHESPKPMQKETQEIEKDKKVLKQKNDSTKEDNKKEISHSNNDIDIWCKVIEKAKEERPSITMTQEGVHVISVEEGRVLLHAETPIKKEYIVYNIDFIQGILKEIIGTEAKVLFVDEQKTMKRHDQSDEFEKEELESFFGKGKVSFRD